MAHQAELLAKYPGRTLLCLTVIPPGPAKRSLASLKIAAAAVSAVRGAFSPEYEELRDLETGYEGYFLVSLPPRDAKLAAVTLEDSHPLGRLFDLDVILSGKLPVFPDGVRPLGREELGLPQRTCIICGKSVRECIRTRAHTTEELLSKIDSILCHSERSEESK